MELERIPLLAGATTLLLVRHSHVADNTMDAGTRMCGWADPSLSEKGRQQTERLRAYLAREHARSPIAALYASPLRRTWDTAQVIGTALGIAPRPLPALREISCGDVDGWLLADVRRVYPAHWRRNEEQCDETFQWPGGERYDAFRARALAALSGIAAAHPGERAVVVTHAGVISQVMGTIAGLSAARWSAFRPGNASITELRWQIDHPTIARFDVRDHLLPAAPLPATIPAIDRPDTAALLDAPAPVPAAAS